MDTYRETASYSSLARQTSTPLLEGNGTQLAVPAPNQPEHAELKLELDPGLR